MRFGAVRCFGGIRCFERLQRRRPRHSDCFRPRVPRSVHGRSGSNDADLGPKGPRLDGLHCTVRNGVVIVHRMVNVVVVEAVCRCRSNGIGLVRTESHDDLDDLGQIVDRVPF